MGQTTKHHPENHKSHRAGWLRAAVLGANDGIVSTASLIIGFASAQADHGTIVLSGIAGLVAGAMSMAAGEYVSVSSQSGIERADLAMETQALQDNPDGEHAELADIYVARGLDKALADQVATQLMATNALAAHARDEIGITEVAEANPLQAAVFSAVSFIIGAILPLLMAWLLPLSWIATGVAASSLVFLATLGALSAWAGGANKRRAALRVTFWGAAAMIATAIIGAWFGVQA